MVLSLTSRYICTEVTILDLRWVTKVTLFNARQTTLWLLYRKTKFSRRRKKIYVLALFNLFCENTGPTKDVGRY